MEWLTMELWSPYVVGAGIGILSWIAFLLSDKALGVSTAYARTSGMIEESLRGSAEERRPYYQKFAPKVDWEWMLVLGLILGAFISAQLSGVFALDWVPIRWEARFGETPVIRALVALIGGTIMAFGARWSRGCTSGHGISGTLQLAVSSWIAAACFFIGGIVTAMIIYNI